MAVVLSHFCRSILYFQHLAYTKMSNQYVAYIPKCFASKQSVILMVSINKNKPRMSSVF